MTEYGPKKRGSRLPKYSRLLAGFGNTFHILFLPPCWHKETRRFAFSTTPQILLVETVQNEHGELQQCLENCGIAVQVTLVTSGTEALHFLEKHASAGEPFLLMIDADAPLESGFGLMEKIRASAPLHGLAISIIGATASAEHLSYAIDLKAVSYIVKPKAHDQSTKLSKVLKELFSSLIEPVHLTETLS